jgi:transposase
MSNTFDYRLKMVQWAKGKGISSASREFKSTRKTVRKWTGRYEQSGFDGLKDLSRAPKHIPHRMGREAEARVIELRESHPGWGAIRFKDHYGLKEGHSAIHRVMKQRGLIKNKTRRWQRRKDLSELKAKLRFFDKSQIDTKDLSDIYKYWPFMRRLGLPRYQYGLRELSIGATFYAYANENNQTYAAIFAMYVEAHLRGYGIKTEGLHWQTDNGIEFVNPAAPETKTAFEKILGEIKIEHDRIPPRCSWMQGDIETFNRIIEDEFYDIEDYENGIAFLGKAYGYQLFFNYLRKNRGRKRKAPVDILKERFPAIDPGVLNLPPIRLESLLDFYCQGGYHVPGSAPSTIYCACLSLYCVL